MLELLIVSAFIGLVTLFVGAIIGLVALMVGKLGAWNDRLYRGVRK